MILTFPKTIKSMSKMLVVSIPAETVKIGQLREGDIVEVKLRLLTKRDKEESIKEKLIIPEELKKAVIQSLNIIQEIERERTREKELNKYNRTHKKPPKEFTLEIEEFWVTSSRIRGVIKSNHLCDIDNIKTGNIYIDIGIILDDYGFTEVKRSSLGNQRLIDVEVLKRLNDA